MRDGALKFAIEILQIERAKHRAVVIEVHRRFNECPDEHWAKAEVEERETVLGLDFAIDALERDIANL